MLFRYIALAASAAAFSILGPNGGPGSELLGPQNPFHPENPSGPGRVGEVAALPNSESDELSGLEDIVVDGHSLLQLHRSLVKFSSISGHELDVGEWLGKYLKAAGLTVELQKVASDPINYNVYAYKGAERNTPVVLTSHIDTVPPFWPYYVNGTEIHGRGSCDAKASVATMVIAYLEMIQSGDIKEGQVSLLFVVGEETSGSGMRAASKDLGVQWDVAIFGEPTELKLGVGHKGIAMFDINVEGKASHSGYPELGISATEILVDVLHSLKRVEFPVSALLGESTVNIGRISGGVAANVVPASASATIAIRIAADAAKVEQLVRQAVDVPHVDMPSFFSTEPQYLDFEVPGFESIVLKYTTDVPNLTQPLKKRYLYGPGTIHVAHGDHEYVESGDLLAAVGGYRRLVEHVIGEL